MKNLFIALSLCFSMISFAQTGDSDVKPGTGVGGDSGGTKYSWSDIISSTNMTPKFPKFFIEDHEVSYDQLCLMGDRIRTKQKVRLPDNDGAPDKIGTYLSTERSYEREVCVRRVMGACAEYEVQVVEIPLKFKVEVMKLSEETTVSWEFAFKKEFELPICDTWKLVE